ncbi:MAG: preprotein translocase subunit YajC [Tannerellaceae bacterium]|jgi:preprotein translocase subunit YajC|nr:preprotein translocase subunit YajC [Tannerellaceae bacterium]
MNLAGILLQGSAPAAEGGNNYSFLIMMVLFFVIIYFFMIRPQQKRQKDIQKARESIQAGDKVLTSGGLYGKVREVSDKYMVVEIAEGVKVRVDKNSVFAVNEEAAK